MTTGWHQNRAPPTGSFLPGFSHRIGDKTERAWDRIEFRGKYYFLSPGSFVEL
jgi:hypothetical protein